ncbi:unnamed protein product [Staurois parvus]|uniref:Uncharacterized protein n=1 Tax=Staurois parvus TaxID=386267 RepID=A0ABN9BMS7_9NEOB|nr:unnamed protein product [Staurois parvus]
MGPCTASHCCCLHRHISAMCHFQVSSHCWWVPFCHRVLLWPPIGRPVIGPPVPIACMLPGPVICHGPPSIPPPHAAAKNGPECSWVL